MNKLIFILFLLALNSLYSQSNIFPAHGNVGVGTTNPLTPIHIIGGATMSAGWNKTSILQSIFPVQLFNSNSIKWAGIGYDFSTGMRVWVNSPNEDLPANGTHGLTILNNGNVGVGNGNPLAKLHVEGGINIAPNYYIRKSGDNAIIGYNSTLPGIAIGSGSPTDQVIINAGGDEKLRINSLGKVGIGTNSPSYKLEVVTTGQTGFRLQTSTSSVGNPQIDLFDASNSHETVISSSDGVRVGTYLASYSNHPLLFGTNHSQSQMMLTTSGNLGIGTTSPTEKLSVNGNIRAKKLIISQHNWSDYVFHKNYKLRTINELEKFIQKYEHLPDVPSTKEVQSKGINVGDTQALLLKKIEELTLYIIDLNSEVASIKLSLELLKQKKVN